MTNYAIPDYGNFPNSAGLIKPPIPPVPARASFDTEWFGAGPVTHLRDQEKRFVGEFKATNATIVWSAVEPSVNFSFVSDPANTTTAVGTPVIGHERNGKFFS
jgi:hypothetical protein